jgi:hypothetical protein
VWYYEASGASGTSDDYKIGDEQLNGRRHIRARSRFEISIPPEICTGNNNITISTIGHYIQHPLHRIDSGIESEDFGSLDDDDDDNNDDEKYQQKNVTIIHRSNNTKNKVESLVRKIFY